MGVSSGELDRRITVQVSTTTKDDANDDVVDWTTAPSFQLWASKRQFRGFETVAPQELIRAADSVFEIRRSTRALTIRPETHRIVHDETVFEIVGIQEGKERKDSLQLLVASRPDGRGARGRGNTDNV